MCVTCIFSSHITVKFHYNFSSHCLLQQTSGPYIVASHFLLLYISKYKIKYGPECKTLWYRGQSWSHKKLCSNQKPWDSSFYRRTSILSELKSNTWLTGGHLPFLNFRSLTYLRRHRWNRRQAINLNFSKLCFASIQKMPVKREIPKKATAH